MGLTAVQAAGYAFDHRTAAASGNDPLSAVRVDEDLQVTAAFAPRTYRVAWASANVPTTMLPGETRSNMSFTIRDESNWTWPSAGSRSVRLSYHWTSSANGTVTEGLRTLLPRNVPPAARYNLARASRLPAWPVTTAWRGTWLRRR